MIMSRERCFTHFEFNPQNRIVGKSLLIMKPCTSQWNNSLYAQRDFWCGFWASVLKVIITLSSCPEDTALPNQGGDAHHTQNSPGTTMPWSPAPPTAIYTQILCPAAWEWCHGYLLFFLGSMPSSSGITNWFSESLRVHVVQVAPSRCVTRCGQSQDFAHSANYIGVRDQAATIKISLLGQELSKDPSTPLPHPEIANQVKCKLGGADGQFCS